MSILRPRLLRTLVLASMVVLMSQQANRPGRLALKFLNLAA